MVRKPTLVLAGSMVVYFAARHFGWNLAASRVAVWYFNPFAWQLLFFLGAWIALGGAQTVQSIVRTRPQFWLPIPSLVVALAVTPALQSPAQRILVPPSILAPIVPTDLTNP